jgi:AraC-like DNA-binding protein
MNTGIRIRIRSELGAVLAHQPPYNRLDAAARAEVSDSFFRRDYKPGDLLALKGRPVGFVGFVHSGVFDIYANEGEGARHYLGSLNAGDLFGDLAVMLDGIALGSLVCRTAGRCYLQNKAAFHESLARHETLRTFFLQNALNKLWSIYRHTQPDVSMALAAEATAFEMPRIIEKALAYIEKNFRQPLTLEEMSRGVGLSRFHLSRTFKQYMGKSFKEYLTERRISEAKLLMANEDKNVTEACFAVGFNDTSYFARVFRKCEGLSPSAYRKRVELLRRQPDLLKHRGRGQFVQL